MTRRGKASKVPAEPNETERARSESVGERRRRALERLAGALTGVWPPGALDKLRDEWR